MAHAAQEELFGTDTTATSAAKRQRSGTFVDNMRLPIHRWFRFSAGFSADWVSSHLASLRGATSSLLDPFAGSGTTLLAAEAAGIPAVGFEAHPFLARVARAKLSWYVNPSAVSDAGRSLLRRASNNAGDTSPSSVDLLRRCYHPDALQRLFSLRAAWRELTNEWESEISELLWLAITASLRETSHVGTANWQYLLPKKRKSQALDPFEAFGNRVSAITKDITLAQSAGYGRTANIFCTDARDPKAGLDRPVDLVITSPPYPNNFDYADATRLELTFWGEIERWGDLHQAVRRHLVRACTQHATADRLDLTDLLRNPVLDPIRAEITTACDSLAAVRETRGGKKSYHTMIAGYFLDLADVWHALRKLCRPGATVCFVIGDSAPYGVHIPVERWLGELAISAGFADYRFEKLRDRNTKWKNRKHRVPLHEGRLWVTG